MSDEGLYPYIFKRRSVRKYQKEPLDPSVLSDISTFIDNIVPLVPGIRTEIRVLNEQTIKGMFRTNAPHYIAFYSEKKDGYLPNAGFMLQQLDLYLAKKGIGNCWQAGAKLAKGGGEPPQGMELVIMTSFGRPAEEIYRKGPDEFKRKEVTKISSVKGMENIIEAARLAPSSVNNQSWYFTGGDGKIYAFAERSLITDHLNRINVGIALCHMWLAAQHEGRKVSFDLSGCDADMIPKGYAFVATMTIE
ncbi:MAG: nitroreductase [Methanomassiliicoccales archaeon]|nr:MAG: nitroreductase [Methanomassiliicoccales archaeon]